MADISTADSRSVVEPKSMAEVAHDAQCRWASQYAHLHRKRRTVSWVIAATLIPCVAVPIFDLDTWDSALGRLGLALLAGIVPLALVSQAARSRLEGYSPTGWVGAWVTIIVEALLGTFLFTSHRYAAGVVYVLALLITGGALSYGLRIPLDASVDWDMVTFEQLYYVKTARSGRAYEKVITDYRKAEQIAAAWLRRFGYRDARVTPDRQDNGVDVQSAGKHSGLAGDWRHPGPAGDCIAQSSEDVGAVLGGGGDVTEDGVPVPGDFLGP